MAQPPATSPDEPVAPPAVDLGKANLEIERLRLEVAKLRREATGIGRVTSVILPMVVPTLTAAVAIVGIGLSILTARNQYAFQQTDAHNKALQMALDMATDNKSEADRRIAGINQLRQFWGNPADEIVVATTLAAILTMPDKIPDAARARCAAADAIGTVYQYGSDPGRIARIKRLLYGSTSEVNRPTGVVTRQNYLLRREADADPAARAGDSLEVNFTCETPLGATREAIRKNWEDLRAINLNDIDLGFTLFYEADLAKSHLSRTSLRETDFRCANLAGAVVEDFAAGDKPDVLFANIRGIGDNSAGFVAYARAHGAIDVSDGDWAKWKASNFDGAVLKTLLGPAFPAARNRDLARMTLVCEGVIP